MNPPTVDHILETCLYGEDLPAMERFYRDVIGLELYSRKEDRHVFFRCGGQMFLVFNPATTRDNDAVPPHGANGPGHVAFAVKTGELDGWREHLQEHGVAIEEEVTWPTGAHSLYFRDPAGNSVELAEPVLWGLES